MPLARSTLEAGGRLLTLPVNPYTAQWGYTHNTSSQDTLGGRVVQLLSVQVTDLQVTSVAGGRRELQKIADDIKAIMEYHVRTSLPAKFVVPSRAWKFNVYVRAMPQIGWDVAATSYPYQLSMAVNEDLTGVKTRQITQATLSRLAEGIGYNPAVHGGNAGLFTEFVDSVLKLAPELARGGPEGSGPDGGGGTASQWNGKGGLWQPDVANAPWEGRTIKDQIYNIWRSVFGSQVAKVMTCIAGRESGYQPRAYNSYTSDTRHYVYGLYQISDVHRAHPWWPSGVSGTNGGLMFDPEYNTRSAMMIYKQQGYKPWVSTSGQCGV